MLVLVSENTRIKRLHDLELFLGNPKSSRKLSSCDTSQAFVSRCLDSPDKLNIHETSQKFQGQVESWICVMTYIGRLLNHHPPWMQRPPTGSIMSFSQDESTTQWNLTICRYKTDSMHNIDVLSIYTSIYIYIHRYTAEILSEWKVEVATPNKNIWCEIATSTWELCHSSTMEPWTNRHCSPDQFYKWACSGAASDAKILNRLIDCLFHDLKGCDHPCVIQKK